VQLGVELTRAIVARRPDSSVTFTFEAEHPDLLAALERSPRTGWGYGPADYTGSLYAVWRRLLPFAIVCAGIAPRQNLLRVTGACRHAVLVAPPEPVDGRFDRIYPTHAAPCPGPHSAPCADLDVLLAQPASGADLSQLASGDSPRTLWWWQGSDAAAVRRIFALFRGHLPRDLLFVSGPACRELAAETDAVVTMSAWPRTAIPPGRLVLVDDPAWMPALAACAAGAHFESGSSLDLYRALASGASASTSAAAAVPAPLLAPAVPVIADENALVAAWAALASDPVRRHAGSEASRQAFAAERSLAYATVSELLERICRWA
jgi:hypothetical protein